jgi:hypothetical protein
MDESHPEVSFSISILGCRVADGKPKVFTFEPRTMIKASLVMACLCQIAHVVGNHFGIMNWSSSSQCLEHPSTLLRQITVSKGRCDAACGSFG